MRPHPLLALLLAGCATASSPSGGAPPAVASALPDFELASVDGDRVRLSDYLGKDVVVLSFWATWCEPCKTELPQLDKIYSAHHEQGLTLLSIAMDDPSTAAGVAPYVKRNGFHFPVLLDSETKAAALYNKLKSAPYTVVIDRQGKIVSEKTGYEPGAEKALEDELVTLLGAHP
jgi:peroxiredoxin